MSRHTEKPRAREPLRGGGEGVPPLEDPKKYGVFTPFFFVNVF
jgi:hypothetical protein